MRFSLLLFAWSALFSAGPLRASPASSLSSPPPPASGSSAAPADRLEFASDRLDTFPSPGRRFRPRLTAESEDILPLLTSTWPSFGCRIPSSQLVPRSSLQYASLVSKFAVETSLNSASVVALPETAADVRALLRCVTRFGIAYDVLGGGHKMDTSLPPALVLSTRNLRRFEYDAESQTLEVGPGWRWKDVYDKMDALTEGKIAPVGGRVSAVGVGGFLLGAGDSWLTSAHGFGSANILQMQVVTADGNILSLDPHDGEKHRQDLFDAFRGAQNQFGIVTSFKLQCHPVSQVHWSGFWAYDLSQLPQVSAALQPLVDTRATSAANAIITLLVLQGRPLITANIWYNGTQAAAYQLGVFQQLARLPRATGTPFVEPAEKRYVAVNEEQDAGLQPGRYRLNTLTVAELPEAFLEAVGEELENWTQKYPFLQLGSGVLLEPLRTGAFDARNMATPGSAWPPPLLPLDNRRRNERDVQPFGAIVGIQAQWANASDDDAATKAIAEFRRTLSRRAEQMGLTKPMALTSPLTPDKLAIQTLAERDLSTAAADSGSNITAPNYFPGDGGGGGHADEPFGFFPNYALRGDVSPQMIFGAQGFQRLQRLKRKWDPHCVFYQGFALSDDCYGQRRGLLE